MILWMDGLDDLNGAEDVLFNDDAQSYSQGEHPNQWGRANGALSVGQNVGAGQLYLDIFPTGGGVLEGGIAFWMYNQASNTDDKGWRFCDSAGLAHFKMDIRSSNVMRFKESDNTVLVDLAHSFYQWTHWEIQFKIDSSTGYLKVRRNEVELANGTGLDMKNPSGAAEFCRLELSSPNVAPFWGNRIFDDLVVYDFTAPNQDWIGMHRIKEMGVSGAGASADFGLYPNGGEVNYENIDETVPDGDTSYNVSGTSTDLDDVALDDYAEEGNIIAIAASVTAKQESVDTTQLKVGVITEGAATDEATFDVGSAAYKRKTHVIHNNPDDSLPWDVADLDGLKLKYEIA